MSAVDEATDTAARTGSVLEVLRVFLRLGLTSFRGPVAHLGYFRAKIVERRKWVDEAHYLDIIALCQFLPARQAARPASHWASYVPDCRVRLPHGSGSRDRPYWR